MLRALVSPFAIGLLLLSGIGGWIQHDHAFEPAATGGLCVVDHALQVKGRSPSALPTHSPRSSLALGGQQHEHVCLACQLSRSRTATAADTGLATLLANLLITDRSGLLPLVMATRQPHPARGPPQLEICRMARTRKA